MRRKRDELLTIYRIRFAERILHQPWGARTPIEYMQLIVRVGLRPGRLKMAGTTTPGYGNQDRGVMHMIDWTALDCTGLQRIHNHYFLATPFISFRLEKEAKR